MKKSTIIFIIPTYNRLAVIAETLRVNEAICSRHGAKIVVIDNNSNDGTYKYIFENYKNIIIIKNESNIGLKGSFKRALMNFSDEDQIIIFLSDEDIIYEPGLNSLNDQSDSNAHRDRAEILIFNHINKTGKDFQPRRVRKLIKSWLDIEILSFGLISGFGYRISKSALNSIAWSDCMDSRNNYPHWIFSFDGRTEIKVHGLPISAMYKESEITYLNEEWKSKKNHFSDSAIYDYLIFHKSRYNSFDASLFRMRYRALGYILNIESSLIRKIVSVIIFSLTSPVQALSFVVRKFNI